MHQRVGAGGAVGLGRVLQLVVADTILAGNKDHCRWHDIGKVAGIMPGAGGDAAVAIAECLGGVLDCVDEFGVEDRWRFAPDRLERNLDLAPDCYLRDRATQILVDRIERLGLRAADIGGEGDLAGNDVAGRRRNHRFAHCAHRVRAMRLGDTFDRQHEFR